MKYKSTRGRSAEVNAAEAIIKGIAPDGGLFVPCEMPHVTAEFVEGLVPLTYRERAARVLSLFLADYTTDEISGCIERAYGGGKFDTDKVAPIRDVGDTTVLELWHGPTSAFKDMALQLLPQLMSVALKKTGEKREILILVATSGDTGKAALAGFADAEQIKIMVFYPDGGVSPIQRLQMVTQAGGNVSVVAVRGNFDDAQSGVKKIFGDKPFNDKLDAANVKLSSANSINWGRLVPQIVYYFSAYADMIGAGKIKNGDEVNYTVPTGNFGNILAGYYAKRMGLPVGRLICASNKNNVLTDFIRTGKYDKNREFYKTISPSMDILISSNLERLLYHVTDADTVRGYMDALAAGGSYTVSSDVLAKIDETFWAGCDDDDATKAIIKSVYDENGYVLDTHTAVAWGVAHEYMNETHDARPMVVVSTASPYKFSASVLDALGVDVEGDDPFVALDALEKKNSVKAPKGLSSLRGAKVLHDKTCDKDAMENTVFDFVK